MDWILILKMLAAGITALFGLVVLFFFLVWLSDKIEEA